jgi:hypothetical protein
MKNGRTLGPKQSFHPIGASHSPDLRRRVDDGLSVRPVLICKIYFDGAVGKVATRRFEAAVILKNDDIDGVIGTLHRKADTLTATTANPFQNYADRRPNFVHT